jgi:endopeptidase La
MVEKKNYSKKNIAKNINPDIVLLIEKKILFFSDLIQKTILHVQKNKSLDILGINEVNTCTNILLELSKKIKDINSKKIIDNTDSIINDLQYINNEFSSLFKLFGTESIEDLLWVCFGNNSVNNYINSDINKYKFDLLKKYFHPISYNLLSQKKDVHDNIDTLTKKSQNLESIDISVKTKQFHIRVYGIQVIVHNLQEKKSLVITGILDDINIDFLDDKFINNKKKEFNESVPDIPDFNVELFEKYLTSLSLKDYLINDPQNLYLKYNSFLTNLNNIRNKTIPQLVKDFISNELFIKRKTIIHLLIKSDTYDNQYLAYLLYDLLSNDNNGNIDTQEQIVLFDSFPWVIKKNFKEAMKKTIQYTNELTNFDTQKIPLEQQICLLKVSDVVKEKAMQKLKDVKSKSEDSGSKARQYLEGLLKIPFNIYKKEEILNIMNEIKYNFYNFVKSNNICDIKDNYTNLEILNFINEYKETSSNTDLDISLLENKLVSYNKNDLQKVILKINEIIDNNSLKDSYLKNGTKNNIILQIINFFKTNKKYVNNIIPNFIHDNSNNFIKGIEDKYGEINKYMLNVKSILDKSVYGHENAKKQIERIIGQWINGKQDGYCFGFEGPPGVGKTSLAKKGLSECLKDMDGNGRPFAMIQMGGDSNGSSLHGHNYTYVGSTWGSIVQILMDKKCMNPIIFIDEIDKISKTEHGKEIIGILTHLLDPAQNECFQDKYFSGIDLDLSKALFILSYNDVDAIDKILLDRIHRIRFNNLSLNEKIVISNMYILPEIYKKMGLENMFNFENDVLKFIIDEYTSESGVRKLKEVLFEIIGEINLDILKNINIKYDIPINITIDDIKNKYFKDKQQIKLTKIHNENKIGIINGLWANAYGRGGVIPIQSKWRPGDKFLSLHLTGLQGDVMKESMNVALTLAWNLTSDENKAKILNSLDKNNGVHIHCPEGSTPKDGPSAGTAITTCIYSLINNKKIKYDIGITGEITLDGKVTEIGGLDLKFLGGIKAGIKEFIFPKENESDYNKFIEKYKDEDIINNIKFVSVNTIEEVFDIIFE